MHTGGYMHNRSLFSIALAALTFLSGCLHQLSSRRPLVYSETKDNFTLSLKTAKSWSLEQEDPVFDRLAKNCRMVKATLTNNSYRSVTLDAQSFSIPVLSRKEAIACASRSTAGRSAADFTFFFVGGTCIAIAGLLLHPFFFPALPAVIGASVMTLGSVMVFPGALIAPAAKAHAISKDNKTIPAQIDTYENLLIQERSITINPGETCTVFVPFQWSTYPRSNAFTVTIGNTSFDVALTKSSNHAE